MMKEKTKRTYRPGRQIPTTKLMEQHNTKGKNMYQIFYMPENSFDIHVADVSREYFAEFCKDKLIVKILPY